MDGGGGQQAPAPTSQTVTQTTIPDWMRPQYEQLMGQASALTNINNNPYQQYQGQLVAGFDPLQTNAFSQLSTFQLPTQTQDASNTASGIATQGQNYQNYQTGRFGTPNFNNPALVQSYMNPYIQSALAPTLQLMQQNAGIGQRTLAQQAQQAGAFGGYRQGIQQGVQAGQDALAQGNVIGNMYNQGFTQAGQNFQSDAARMLQAQQAREQSRQYGAGLGLQGLNTSLQAAGLQGQLGQQQYAQQMGLNQAQQMAGAQIQGLNQQNLGSQYQDFLSQQNWPYKNLSFMADIMGHPMSNSSSSIYQAPPTTTQSLMGLGLGAYGLSGMLGGGRKAGGIIKKYAGGGNIESTLNTLQKLPPGYLNKMQSYQPFTGLVQKQNQQLQTAAPVPAHASLTPPMEQGLAGMGADPMMGFKDGGIVGYADGGAARERYPLYREPFSTSGGSASNSVIPTTRGTLRDDSVLMDSPANELWTSLKNTLPDSLSGIAGYNSIGAAWQLPQALYKWATTPQSRLSDAPTQPKPLGKTTPESIDYSRLLGPDVASVGEKGSTVVKGPAGAAAQKAEARRNFELEKAPDFGQAKTAAGMYGEYRGLADLARKDNPLYGRRDQMAGRYDQETAMDPYADALAAANAVINSPHRYGKGAAGILGPLAEAVTAGGISQIGRSKEDIARQEKLLQLDVALRAGDEKTAAHIQDQLQKDEEKRMQAATQIYGARAQAQTGAYHADTAAEAARYAADRHLLGVQSLAASNSGIKEQTVKLRAYDLATQRAMAEVNGEYKNKGLNIDLNDATYRQAVQARIQQYLPGYMKVVGQQPDGIEGLATAPTTSNVVPFSSLQ